MADDSPSEPALSDAAVRELVDELTDGWSVASIRREAHGTDAVATLEVETPSGARRVVLKAATAEHLDDAVARAEPRLLRLADAETSIPVPSVLGYRDEHPEHPAPFFLLEYVPGENFEDRADELGAEARERVVREAGRNLAELHELGPLPAVGTLGVPAAVDADPDAAGGDSVAFVDGAADGRLAVLQPEEPYDDARERELSNAEGALDALEDGGYFPEHAEEPERFADLVPELRSYVCETVPDLPEPEPPTYCHTDYRYGNLLLDPGTGRTRAVIDWGNLAATDPAYNLASTESLLLAPDRDDPERTDELRAAFREAYEAAREGWRFDDAVRERVRVYHLICRLHAMACLPLWYEEPDERDRREREHRAFVASYLEDGSAPE